MLYKELREQGLRFLNSDRSSLLRSNTVSDELKFLSRFFNDSAECFIDWHAQEFDINSVIFMKKLDTVNSDLTPFKFNFAKECIKQFSLNNSTSFSFQNFVQKSIISETQKSRVITTFVKFQKKRKGYYGTYLNDSQIFFHTDNRAVCFYIPTELYRRMDRTFLRTLDEIGTACPTAKVIEAVKKELGGNITNLTTLQWF